MTLYELYMAATIKPLLVVKNGHYMLLQELLDNGMAFGVEMSASPTEGYVGSTWLIIPASSSGWSVVI